MWQKWVGALIGALAGMVIVPSAAVTLLDALGIEVDPILGGVIPALIGIPLLGTLGYYLAPKSGPDELN
jgi:hypothetical protein